MTKEDLEFLKYYSLTSPYPLKWTELNDYYMNQKKKKR